MIPINDYQACIYKNLKEKSVTIYDEVKEDAKFPIHVISDYTLSDGVTKDSDYTFNQKFDIYSTYEGKKEVNTIASTLIENVKAMVDTPINEEWCIVYVDLESCNVYRNNDGDVEIKYIANINFNISIARC